MTVTCVPSAFVTCTSYLAALLLLSFSVVARSAVPPVLATAAALAFVATSPVRSVSPLRRPPRGPPRSCRACPSSVSFRRSRLCTTHDSRRPWESHRNALRITLRYVAFVVPARQRADGDARPSRDLAFEK